MNVKELREKLERALKSARDIAARAEARDFTEEERDVITKAVTEARDIKARLEQAQADDELRSSIKALAYLEPSCLDRHRRLHRMFLHVGVLVSERLPHSAEVDRAEPFQRLELGGERHLGHGRIREVWGDPVPWRSWAPGE